MNRSGDDYSEPPMLRSACQLLAFVQQNRALPYTGDASSVRAFVSGCMGVLHAVMDDASQFERFGRFTLDLCELHGSLTPAQARRQCSTGEGRRRAASAGIRLLVDMLDAFELSGDPKPTGSAGMIVH